MPWSEERERKFPKTIFLSLGVMMFFPVFISKDMLAYFLIPFLKVTLIYTLKRKKSTLNLLNLNNKTIAIFGYFSYNSFSESLPLAK